MKRFLLFILLGILIVGLFGAWLFHPELTRWFLRPTGNSQAQPGLVKEEGEDIEVIAENLEIPWEIVFLPDESLLVTQRPGQLVRVLPESQETIPVEGVAHVGEGGLLGIALHPQYETNHWLYVYSTTGSRGSLSNRVERYRFDETANTLADRLVILEGIAGSPNHDGGRIAFGPDGLLYVTTGDAENPESAQDISSLNGKILRISDDGSIPADNPFGNAVYSYGHRNPQGLSWDAQGRLWETEHGPSGSQTGNDEVNLIESGGNYGWPDIRGTQTREGMTSPVIESGLKETWAPADALVVDDMVFFTGLRGQALYSARMRGNGLSDFTAHFDGEYGRLRAVVLSPDGDWLYFTTSNTDGRGTPVAEDDRIVRVKTSLFF